MKIAISGKGGVGKTLIAAGIAHSFAKKGFRTIAIDADPSPNLALTLGLSVDEANRIEPISRNKELINSKTKTKYSGVYRLNFKVDDIVRDFSVKTPLQVNLIVMGTVTSMGSGCTCQANTVISALLRHIVVDRDEAVIVDMEAGVEHLGRGTARHVDTMIIIADANIKSLTIANRINNLAEEAGIQKIFLVGNKVASQSQKELITQFSNNNNLRILGFVPFDQNLADLEMRGETPLKHKELQAVQRIEELSNILYLEKNPDYGGE